MELGHSPWQRIASHVKIVIVTVTVTATGHNNKDQVSKNHRKKTLPVL